MSGDGSISGRFVVIGMGDNGHMVCDQGEVVGDEQEEQVLLINPGSSWTPDTSFSTVWTLQPSVCPEYSVQVDFPGRVEGCKTALAMSAKGDFGECVPGVDDSPAMAGAACSFRFPPGVQHQCYNFIRDWETQSASMHTEESELTPEEGTEGLVLAGLATLWNVPTSPTWAVTCVDNSCLFSVTGFGSSPSQDGKKIVINSLFLEGVNLYTGALECPAEE